MDFLSKIQNLPKDVRAFFVSNTSRLEIERACFMYNLKEEKIKNISKLVGFIFSGDIKLENFPQTISKNLQLEKNTIYGIVFEINKRIFNKFPNYFKNSTLLSEQWNKLRAYPKITEQEAWKRVLEIEPWILEEEKENKKQQEKNKYIQSLLIDFSFSKALKTIPEIKEQLITGDLIKLKIFPKPVRPSIKNWLSDYTYNIGYKNNDSIKRSSYIFQNENAKKLNSFEKEKLSFILKAYDEDLNVKINKKTKLIVFPEKEIERKANIFKEVDQTEKNMRFTSPQRMSYETKSREKNNIQQKASPVLFKNKNIKIPPNNIVNLKEE